MSIRQHIHGIQHVGIPTFDIDKTVSFFEMLGFENVYQTNDGGDRVCFLKFHDLTIETYEAKETARKPGSIDHVALDVDDIESVYEEVNALGYKAIEGGVQILPFWAKGVKYFTICGPNGELIEFSQIL